MKKKNLYVVSAAGALAACVVGWQVYCAYLFVRDLGPPCVLLGRDAKAYFKTHPASPDLVDRLCLGWELNSSEIAELMSCDSLPVWILVAQNKKTPTDRIKAVCASMDRSRREHIKSTILSDCEKRGYGALRESEKLRMRMIFDGER